MVYYPPFNRVSNPESDSTALKQLSPEAHALRHSELFEMALRLDPQAKQSLCQLLLTQLSAEQTREVIDFSRSELAAREGKGSLTRKPAERCTRLVLKKDYSFQKLNLAHPTQYFVYLVRRKPKLDRYIGALFYVPSGVSLSYFPDAEGRIVFTPPHNVFKLVDSESAQTQVVRLASIEPPPAEYTFERGQEDVPEIYLCLDYLDPVTYEWVRSERYHYPTCMYEGGKLDRYRWKVEPLELPVEIQTRLQSLPAISEQTLSLPVEETGLLSGVQRRESLSVSSETAHTITQLTALADSAAIAPATQAPATPAVSATPRPKKFILTELPKANTATYYLADPQQSVVVLERLRIFAALSELAMPHAKWVVEERSDTAIHRLVNSKTKRLIVQFSTDETAVMLQNSFPVIMTAFRDLARSASQTSQRMTREQQSLTHKLHVEMGLPHKNPLEILEKLFGVTFQDTPVLSKVIEQSDSKK
ncbi:MAG: hypothetical protein HY785_21030 [Oscillatoriophycideae cyanobacterium NC_groundwater_1537_Pr4_S-0.65um_50_18]|nr:hypothetical protein [Oscillatoriophycideae cyanobacterium NC_groundwater_1537_Pr4_S-0.65um_50_18]